jgi:sentrin-specific protease 7
MEVVLCPDYVVYRDIYCTSPLLSFSPGCIKISGSNPQGNEGSFDFEWGIDDLIDVRCQWMRKVRSDAPMMFADSHICVVLKFYTFFC